MLSVIVPVFNSAESLSQCLSSILIQSYKDIEIIIVNDGSADNSIDIVNYYIEKYKDQIKYFELTERNWKCQKYRIRKCGWRIYYIC